VRALPDEDMTRFLEQMRKVINDPAITVEAAPSHTRPGAPPSSLHTEAFEVVEAAIKRHYGVITLPVMSTGATDMAYLREKGMQCFGIGPMIDSEDGPRGFGAHSDQERLLESELYRFVRMNWDVITTLARSK
jgi:acetylornithine deacetylase/succinyl-diaminopimelate desuccinylase-like protein